MINETTIGIFDSGLGGLTVMQQLMSVLPHENMVYFGDTAYLPYGDKTKNFIIERSLSIASFLIQKGAKLIVVACHTASTNALEILHQHFAVPILGITQPTIHEVVKAEKKRIAILATDATIKSGIYQHFIGERLPDSVIFPLACPKFVPLIEQGIGSIPLAKLIVHETLKELASQQIELAVLGSTHYPLIQDLIQQELGEHVVLIDPAKVLAENVRTFLIQNHLYNNQQNLPAYHFHTSKDSEKFQHLAEKFLKLPSEKIVINN